MDAFHPGCAIRRRFSMSDLWHVMDVIHLLLLGHALCNSLGQGRTFLWNWQVLLNILGQKLMKLFRRDRIVDASCLMMVPLSKLVSWKSSLMWVGAQAAGWKGTGGAGHAGGLSNVGALTAADAAVAVEGALLVAPATCSTGCDGIENTTDEPGVVKLVLLAAVEDEAGIDGLD